MFDTSEIVTSSFIQNSQKVKLVNDCDSNTNKNRLNPSLGSKTKKTRSKNGSFIVNLNTNQSRAQHLNSNASISQEESQHPIMDKFTHQIFLSKEEKANKASHLELKNHLMLLKTHGTADKIQRPKSKPKSKKKSIQHPEKLL